MKFLFNIFNQTALHIAINNNNLEIVRLLLQKPELNINTKYVSSFFLVNVI